MLSAMVKDWSQKMKEVRLADYNNIELLPRLIPSDSVCTLAQCKSGRHLELA